VVRRNVDVRRRQVLAEVVFCNVAVVEDDVLLDAVFEGTVFE
jgi:hypothetical protein